MAAAWIGKLTGSFREFGALGGLIYLFNRVAERVTGHVGAIYFDAMVQPIADRPLVPERLARAFEVREIGRSHPQVGLMPVREGVPEFRFAQGAVCLGIFRSGECIGYMWYCRRAFDEDVARITYRLTPPEEAVFDFDFYIYPEHRKGLGFAVLWDEANRRFRELGVRYSYSRVSRFNRESQRSHEKFGWKRIGSVVVLRIGRLELGVLTMTPFVHASIRRAGRTQLELRPDVLEAN